MAMKMVLCQKDAYLKAAKFQVVACTPAAVRQSAAAAGAKAAKGKESVFDVELTDTILYPEGGGQPCDFGTINGVPVSNVAEVNGRILHQVPTPIDVGTEVEVVVDWNRRFDHMQQHSSQHLISAIARSLFNFNTVSWWLASYPSECYIDLDAPEVSSEQLTAIQSEVNRIIRDALPMKVHVFENRDAALACPSAPKLFKDVPNVPGEIRVVEMEGYDFNPCSGTHLSSTSQMQLINLVRVDKVKGKARLIFLAGGRALGALEQANTILKQLSTILCAGPEQHAEKVAALAADLKNTVRDRRTNLKDMAALESRALLADAVKAQTTVLAVHRIAVDLLYLQMVADTVLAEKPTLLLLLSTVAAPGDKSGMFLLAGSDQNVNAAKATVQAALAAKGGGKNGRFQGKSDKMDDKSLAAAVEQLGALFASENAGAAAAGAGAPNN